MYIYTFNKFLQLCRTCTFRFVYNLYFVSSDKTVKKKVYKSLDMCLCLLLYWYILFSLSIKFIFLSKGKPKLLSSSLVDGFGPHILHKDVMIIYHNHYFNLLIIWYSWLRPRSTHMCSMESDPSFTSCATSCTNARRVNFSPPSWKLLDLEY